MNKNYFQKGFTLIEMLIVVAIIAILASVFLVGLTGYRSSAYDSRRLSDLQQVQSYLELYYNANRSYPLNITTWSDLQKALINGKIGVTTIPSDPAGGSGTSNYQYDSCSSGQGYILSAPITATSKIMLNSASSTSITADCSGGMFQASTCGTLIDSGPNSTYCVAQ